MNAPGHRKFGLWHTSPWEFAIMRVLFAILVYQSLPLGEPFSSFPLDRSIVAHHDQILRPPLVPLSHLVPASRPALSFASQPHPNGLAQWVRLDAFADPAVVGGLGWVAAASLLLYAFGRALPIVVPILGLLSIGFGSLANSQGAIDHRFQLISMILVAQSAVLVWPFAVRAAARLGVGRPSREPKARPSERRNDKLHYAAMVVLIAAYTTAGVAKLERSDGAWIANSHFIGIQVVKSYRQNFYNDLDRERFGELVVPFADSMLAHPNLTRLVLAGGLFLELFAFLALYDRRTALVFGLGFISFHYAIDVVLGLGFYNHEKLVWILLVNGPYWAWRARSAWRQLSSGSRV